MTDYDWWLRDHPGAINGPDYYEPFYEFSRRTNAEFRRDVCELVARYPSPVRLPIDSRIEGTIWAQVFTAFSESNVVPSTDVPKDILDGSIAPMFEDNRCQMFPGGYRHLLGYIFGGGIEAGYRALWHKDRYDISRDYSVDDHGMVRGMSLPTLAACTRKLNPQLNAAIDALVAEMQATKNSVEQVAKGHAVSDEKMDSKSNQSRKLNATQIADLARRYDNRESVLSLSRLFSVSRRTIDKELVKAGRKTESTKN